MLAMTKRPTTTLKKSNEHLRIFICGVDSTPDPYSGVSIARSLRMAYPSCELVAVDRSLQSTGLNLPDFDEWLLLSNRRDLAHLCTNLGRNEYFIPCIDDEIYWISKNLRVSERVLMPASRCISRIQKPARSLARMLEMRTPGSILIPANQHSINAFLRKCRSPVWRKGRVSGAELLSHVAVRSSADSDSSTCGSNEKNALLQVHIDGWQEQVSFAAYKGRLLGAVWMRKCGVTSLGKTWSGVVTDLSAKLRSRLQAVVRRLSWHGGGAFEFIRDKEARLWLIDVNPRFPAWVHGATLCGHNLPAELLSAASGIRAIKSPHRTSAFARMVVEVAVRKSLASHLKPHLVE